MFFMHPFWGWGWGLWWWPLHGLFSALILVLMVLLFARILRPGPHWAPTGRSSALRLLEERYARGEIQREEYLQKKKDLGG